eukprot:TRINITY_DN7480_c0_g1_i1.p1 TRINITY_DN7480_c0_g1~~TRINITY_DN7480_c0_g1_i1.p1  ORF type:complete len:199 (-),score=42.39 TRINITY_DN7480_c0_g1_i1:47-643(-)
MELVHTEQEVGWLQTSPTTAKTYLCDEVPSIVIDKSHLLAGVFVFVFNEKHQVLLTKLRKRGWDMLGGKVEASDRESTKNVVDLIKITAQREVYEESKVLIDTATEKNFVLLGIRHFCPIEQGGGSNSNGKEFYFAYYMVPGSGIQKIDEFVEEPTPNGAIERGWFAKEDAEKMDKVAMHSHFYEKSLRILEGGKQQQ